MRATEIIGSEIHVIKKDPTTGSFLIVAMAHTTIFNIC